MSVLGDMMRDLRSLTPASFVAWARNFDPNNLHDLANLSGIFMFTVLMGVVSIIIYAQLTPSNEPAEQHTNAALGAGSEAVSKPGSPPLPPPTQIVSMRVYPIKSCRGIEVDETRLRKTGLLLDRNWMFISKSDRKFMTIRSNPAMTLVDTNIVEKDKQTHLEISVQGGSPVTIPAFPTKEWLAENTTLTQVEIWEEPTDAYEYADSINAVFSAFFKQPVALVYKGPQPRNINVNGRPELYGRAQEHHFADVMSLQIASEASLKDLNSRLAKLPDAPDALTIERFRPNIIVRGRDDHPWEEDAWKRVRITTTLPDREMLFKLDLDVVARCARCQVPNVDPDTAEKHAREPWTELMKFRRVDQGGPAKYKPCFGMLCVPKNEGIVMVGSTLEVLETTDKHLYNTASFKDL